MTRNYPQSRAHKLCDLKGMPLRKAPGPDDISTKMLVVASGRGVTEITNLANMMYSEGRSQSRFGTAKCEKHRTISLMSHVIKLVMRVIMNRIRGRTLSEISAVQYDFMPDRGTRNRNICVEKISRKNDREAERSVGLFH